MPIKPAAVNEANCASFMRRSQTAAGPMMPMPIVSWMVSICRRPSVTVAKRWTLPKPVGVSYACACKAFLDF